MPSQGTYILPLELDIVRLAANEWKAWTYFVNVLKPSFSQAQVLRAMRELCQEGILEKRVTENWSLRQSTYPHKTVTTYRLTPSGLELLDQILATRAKA